MVNTTLNRRYVKIRITGLLLIIIWIVFVQKKNVRHKLALCNSHVQTRNSRKNLKKQIHFKLTVTVSSSAILTANSLIIIPK
jgi:hypothetical protein